MKLDMVGIIVEDMKRAIHFYNQLGLTVSFGNESSDYVELETEGVRLSLNTKKMITGVLGFEPQTIGDKIELAFLCESKEAINNLVTQLKKEGILIIKEPWSAPWGQYYSLIRDHDGNIISLFINE